MFKKDTFKLVVVASVALFLPYILFAQCAVVGYAFGQDYVGIEYTTTTFPSSLQLDRLAHVIAVGLGVIQKRLKYKTKQTTNNKLATVFKLINFNIKKRGECAEIIHIFNSSV
jgi:hypothetical protein